MTDITHGAPAADDDCFVSTLFDQALRQRETQSAITIDRSHQDSSLLQLVELPPQKADSE